MTNYFNNLDRIARKYEINLFNKDGTLRNTIDVLEDMYSKMTAKTFSQMMYEIQEEEFCGDLFNQARNKKYTGIEE